MTRQVVDISGNSRPGALIKHGSSSFEDTFIKASEPLGDVITEAVDLAFHFTLVIIILLHASCGAVHLSRCFQEKVQLYPGTATDDSLGLSEIHNRKKTSKVTKNISTS